MYHSHRRSLLGLTAVAALVLTGFGVGASAPALATPVAEAPQPAQARLLAEPSLVSSTTQMHPVLVPTAYGSPLLVSATVEIDGPSNLTGQVVELWLNGEYAASSPLIYTGSGRFAAVLLTPQVPDAGEYSAVAKFPGLESPAPGMASVSPSESEPYTFTIVPRPSITIVTSAPVAENAFAPVDVTASVEVAAFAPTGTAALMLDDTEIATTALQASTDSTTGMIAEFTGVRLPATGGSLWVKYLGSADGNFAPSESARNPIRVDSLDTRVDFTATPSQIRADAVTNLDVTVTNETLRSAQDPVGAIEVLVDGDIVLTMAQAQDDDPQAGDGVSRYSVPLGGAGLGLGEHSITVNFQPEPGFKASSSDALLLTVLGIPTELTTDVTKVTGTPARPPIVSVQASVGSEAGATTASIGAGTPAPDRTAAAAGAAVAGYVQAFVAEEPLGDPASLVGGTADVELAGLAVGTYQVEIRFTPTEDPDALKASTVITAEITGDSTPNPGTNPAPEKPEPATEPTLARTGAMNGHTSSLLGVASTLILGAGIVISASRRHGKRPQS